ncbi:hypothetical protein ANCCEY_05025 [Ancylostoma ceylanicum]|uniref:Receptor L-domain domain-containing protein n=1 Tax=Ancylostoma ceylanicum TaxID=53326 RepID=A0A0D6LUZ2_9BILA|nr:hypothetical protein ANCCEY_05025 [Ancylostoma ceylanicum]
MQVINRLVTCLVVLLCNKAAAISDDVITYGSECANYHELRSLSDYGTFVEDCAGKKVLGFEAGVSNKFYASKLTQEEFNGLFANAVKVSFFIYVENTKFVELKMPKLQELVGGLSIRNNQRLKTFHINRGHKFGRTVNGPTTVTVDGNPVLNQQSYAELRYLCDYCDIFEYTKCSALDPVQPAFYAELVSKCAGERIIKQKPGARFYLKANKMTLDQFTALFAQATHVELCINFQDMQWKQIVFPKLVRLIPCGYGRPAFIIEGNALLEFIELSPQFKFSIDEYLFVILNNPRLRQDIYIIFEQCKGCVVEYRTRCGLERGGYDSPGELLANCAGKRKIVFKYEITVNEFQFQQLCSRAVHMKMCFNIVNTNFREIRCPSLRYIEPCQPGKQVFKIIGNPLLTIIDIPITVIYPPKEKILIVKKNQRVPAKTITKLKQICPICEIEGYFSKCSGLGPITDVMAFVKMCTGQPFIDGREGVILEVDLSKLTEAQINALFAEVVEMKISITIRGSSIKHLRFPKLTKWTSGARGKPALTLVYNFELISVEFPMCRGGCISGAVIQYNPRLPKTIIDLILSWCSNCLVELYVPSCGLGVGGFSSEDFVRACAGKPFIKPEGVVVVIDSTRVSEAEFNAFCSKAVFMEVCIRIIDSNWRSIRCPHLKEIRPCAVGRPVFEIVDNQHLQILDIPLTVVFLPEVRAFVIRGNPLLPGEWLRKMRMQCPRCSIEEATGQPAITIVDNPFFEILEFPTTVKYPRGALIIEIRMNPSLPPNILQKYKPWCPGCTIVQDYGWSQCTINSIKVILSKINSMNIKYDLVCGITKPNFSTKELVAACAGKRYIKPAKGVIVVVKSSDVTEQELNMLCSKVEYMEICIEITNSQFRSLRCPHLKELRPCAPNRPAIKIVNNRYFHVLVIPPNVRYPPNVLIIEFRKNPMIDITIIEFLRKWCPGCVLTPDYACGIEKKSFTMKELVLACAGWEFIRPPPGVQIIITSDMVTEDELNRMCAKAVYMEVCIEIKNSKFKSLRCPHLKQLKSCKPGRPAITIEYNAYFDLLFIPPNVKYPPGELIIIVKRTPRLQIGNIHQLQRWCPHCSISPDYVCGISSPRFTMQQLVAACAGQKHIVPAPGVVIVVKSSSVTEEQMNAMCSKVEVMQICIEITRSMYRSLRCPHLKELRPCQPGRPAITIVDNPHFVILELPTVIVFPKGTLIIELRGNPMLSIEIILRIKKWCPECVVAGDYGKPALTIVENFYLEVLVIPSVIKVPAGELIFVIRDNPRISLEILLQLKRLCPGCSISLDTDCGLTRPANMQQLAAACANKLVIKPSKGHIIEFHSKYVSEAEMNAICAKVVYMEACITISASKFRRFRCPNLRELRPCAPACVLQRRTYSDKELVRTCAGKSIIKPQPGFVLTVSSQHVTEAELNALCSKAIYMEICMVIKASHFKRLRCPMLKELKPCRPGQPAITIVNNLQFVEIQLLPSIRYPHGTLIFEVTGNPRLSITIIELLKKICPHCHITPDYDCGLKRPFTIGQLVSACAGKAVIRPKPGYHIEIHSKDTTEAELNAFCSQVIYLKACITIDASTFRSFKCPHLRELKPCQPGRPAIVVTNNAYLTILEIPVTVIIPTGVTIFKIYGNPLLSIEIIERFRRICPMCRFPVDNACKLEARVYSDKELVKICAGTTKIKPAKGYFLTVSSKHVTEAELNALCSKVTYMEICITITESHFKSLRCPHLKELRPCKPGRPAITIIRNFEFSILEIPSSIIVPKGVLIFEIAENPRLSVKIITILKTICPLCRITANVACDLEGRKYTDKELVRACAGKTIIKPAPGWILVLSSTQTTEEEMNALCSKAIYMEICLEITNSQFKQLRCPHLKELRPCQPGRPAIKIVNNLYFELLEIPFTVVYPRGELILEIHEVPRMPTALIKRLQAFCKSCKITANLGCGLTKRNYSDAEMVAACAGKTIIKPAEGYMLVMSSDTVSEAEMNAVCAKAVYMEICIIIRNSKFRSLKCPHLRELKSCKPGTPAIRILGNPMLTEVSISKTLLYRIGTKTLEIRGNPRLSRKSIKALNKLCPECIIRRQP